MLEGAEEHKLSIGEDRWIALKDVVVGQRIPLYIGENIWPEQLVPIMPPTRMIAATVEDVARVAGVSAHSVYRSIGGKTQFARDRIEEAIKSTEYTFGNSGKQFLADRLSEASRENGVGGLDCKPMYSLRFPLTAPTHATEPFAEFLGYLIGDGNIHHTKNAIGYTTGDRELADRYTQLIKDLFAIEPKVFWDDRTVNGEDFLADGLSAASRGSSPIHRGSVGRLDNKTGRWRVIFYSANVLDLLRSLGIDLKAKAREKSIPDVILRSPKAVVSAFLRAYFDCDGCASVQDGVILSTFSESIAQTLQTVLLNYGILSRRYGPNIRIKGVSARVFAGEINFSLARKRENLRCYLANHRTFKREDPVDEVISVERDVADVYDITVDRTHRYVANGMLHHNSIWHARIMRRLADQGVISDSEVVEFAQLHSSVLSPSRTSLNPYYLGFKMLEDVERRWDNPTQEEQERLGRKPGMGKQKIFEVREMENDVSFLRNYLTEDLIKDLDLYLYKKEGDEWVIAEKNWQKVRDGIVASMTNFGNPYLVIDNGDYKGNRELYMKHLFEGQELDMAYADKTLQNVYLLWGRPVHLETVYDGKRILLTYDGERNSKSSLEK